MPLHTAKEIFHYIDSRLNGFAKVLLIVSLFVVLFVSLNYGSRFINQHFLGIYKSDIPNGYTYITVSPTADMERVLKKYNLWEIEKYAQIEPLVFNRYPRSLTNKEISLKKRIFFHVLLPAALISQEEVSHERRFIKKIIDQIGVDASLVDFDINENFWQNKLSRSSVKQLLAIAEKYQEKNAASLLTKVDVIPISLILAQSAIESAWGGSRFAVSGNNMFGIWTWGENGMVPKQRSKGKNHRVAVFVSILDSVRAYTLILNKVTAYKKFRDIRTKSRDSLDLSEGLLNYSSRRSLYVKDVKNMIKSNHLKKYDTNSVLLKQKEIL